VTIEAYALAHFVLIPVAWLCLQYGLDMLLDDVVPMSRAQIERRVHGAGSN